MRHWAEQKSNNLMNLCLISYKNLNSEGWQVDKWNSKLWSQQKDACLFFVFFSSIWQTFCDFNTVIIKTKLFKTYNSNYNYTLNCSTWLLVVQCCLFCKSLYKDIQLFGRYCSKLYCPCCDANGRCAYIYIKQLFNHFQ